MRVEVVPARRPVRLLEALRRLRLDKLLELVIWPDDSIFWVVPAVIAGRRLVRLHKPSAIVVFMMPYSTGLAGIALSRLTGLPLVLNLDDSPTCTDMHPHFPTRMHYLAARALEDLYIRCADAVVYVSRTNLERVRSRQPAQLRDRLHLVRYGAEEAAARAKPTLNDDFVISYVGAMSGWWALADRDAARSRLRRLYAAWSRFGRYELTTLDQRTSSPAFIGSAIIAAIGGEPAWAGRVRLTIHGNPYPPELVARALASAGVEDVVSVFGPVPHDQIANVIARADLLFLTLPARVDGSSGGRISAKTYEYLMTDRPILAAVPRGENWDYLRDKPGVWLAEPRDRQHMRDVISELAAAKFEGHPRTFDRTDLHEQISYDARGASFAVVVRGAIERRLGAVAAHPPSSSPR